MVKNSTNINKTNNHIAGQIIEHKKTTTNDDGNQNPGLGQAQRCGGFKPYPPDNRISNGSTYNVHKQMIKKPCTYSLPLKNTPH